MKFNSENNESWYYSNLTELNYGRLAMCAEIRIDILKLNSLDLDLSIKPPKEKIQIKIKKIKKAKRIKKMKKIM